MADGEALGVLGDIKIHFARLPFYSENAPVGGKFELRVSNGESDKSSGQLVQVFVVGTDGRQVGRSLMEVPYLKIRILPH